MTDLSGVTIGQNIRRLREAQSLKQRDLAHRVGVAQSTLCDWESGTTNPRHDRLQPLASALGVGVAELLA